MGARLTSRGNRADLTRAGIAIAALYPIGVAALLVALPIVAPRSAPMALATVLSMHLALAAVALVPFAAVRGARSLRVGLLALAVVSGVRFGGEWVSIPAGGHADPATELAILSWNLEFGARAGEAAIDGLKGVDADVIVLQELGPEHAAAIEADGDLTRRYPFRELIPRPGVAGMGVLSAHSIRRTDVADDPVTIETVLDVDGRLVTVITGHPFPGRIGMAGPLPVGFDPSDRDLALAQLRDRVDAAVARGETVIVAGDFNVAPTEPAFEDLTRGLADAHAEVGLGPGWTWRPSRFEGLGLGLLRIDLALAGPGARPIAIDERCDLPGDHCQLAARFVIGEPQP